MTLKELEELAKLGESETLEFKESTAEIIKGFRTLCAFLNTKGGTILFGVSDKGILLGQDVSNNTINKINQEINKIEPITHFDISYCKIGQGNKQIIRLSTPPGEHIPYTYDGKPYYRLPNQTEAMPQERYKQLLLEQAHTTQPWEKLPAIGVSINDLDKEEIIRTIKEGIAESKIDSLVDTNNPAEALHGLGLMKGDVLYNAAVVLFGLSFKPYYFQCRAKLARFRGVDKDEFLDNRQIEGHAFKLYEECLAFIAQYNPIASHFKPGISKRIDEPAYPPLAVREALVNALVHRDYSQHGGAIRIAMYDNRLEIWSSGVLPKGVHLKELWELHTSQPRNELIADTFYRRGLLEEWGRGTNKIINDCRAWGNKDPEFFENSGSFCVRIWAKERGISSIATYEPEDRKTKILSKRQAEIVSLLEKAGELKATEIKEKLSDKLADRTLREDLLYLKQNGFIETKGHGRGATWHFINDAS